MVRKANAGFTADPFRIAAEFQMIALFHMSARPNVPPIGAHSVCVVVD